MEVARKIKLTKTRKERLKMIKRILLLIMIVIMTTSCSEVESDGDKTVKEETILEKEVSESQEKDPKDEIDLSLKPNEVGGIMILMYHNIGQEEEEWVRTADNFRKDLLTLYEKGYRPIRLRDYVSGDIRTPAGYTPIVLTFDDGNKNNFAYLEDGTIDKKSAVGILLDFHKEYPDFKPHASFFLNGDLPFGQAGQEADKINFLLEEGMDVGNHSRTHANFTNISKDKLQEEIGGQAQYLEELIDQEAYRVDTIALPYGSRPKDDSLISFLKEGSHDGVEYNNIAILNVGWNPGYSPYDARFDFESIPRIRASEMKVDNVGIYNYIDYFDKNPQERFISDGFPGIITVPEEKLELIKEDSEKEIYSYKSDKVEN